MSLTAGTKLGSYEVLAPLGAGGMGEVYRASDLKLRREVAIKILPAPFANDHYELDGHAHTLEELSKATAWSLST